MALIGVFAVYKIDGRPAGLALWQLFGTTNQLLAGLALLVITLYLRQRGRNFWVTGIPMVFMMVSTVIAMIANLRRFWNLWGSGGGLLFVVGAVLLALAIWLCAEAVLRFRSIRLEPVVTSLNIELAPPRQP